MIGFTGLAVGLVVAEVARAFAACLIAAPLIWYAARRQSRRPAGARDTV